MVIRVLLVDDSAVIRGLVTKALSEEPRISVVGSAFDGNLAIQMAKTLQPNIIILDIEMPNMDGITALPEILKVSPHSKVIMASTLTQRNAAISLQALSLGASDYLAKPASDGISREDFYRELIAKIIALAPSQTNTAPATANTVVSVAKISQPYPTLAPGTPLNAMGIGALAIASSTGGPQALNVLFEQFKGHLRSIPIFITQHMPPTFTTLLAEQLSKIGGRDCREGKSNEVVIPGCVYIAPGDYHMTAEKNPAGQVVIALNQNPQENFCRPAADPMLRSLSQLYGPRLATLILTGMGQDGMLGAKAVIAQGGSVVAQDEASCVVYGMPKAIVENKLCKTVLPLQEIAPFFIQQIEGKKP